MASTSSSLHSEEQFLCSICLEVFTDPVTTSCGHNYCRTCITQYWDTNDVYKCPLCQTQFYNRPDISVNKVFSEMAEKFKKSKQRKETSSPNQGPKPDGGKTSLNQALTLILTLCVALILTRTFYQFCTESDHKFHQSVPLTEEYEGQKAELAKTDARIQQMIQERQLKIQEVEHSVELSQKDADREIADSVQVFTALISCIERSQAELIDVIEEKRKTTEKQAEGFIDEMQQEISQLEKRSSELKHLSHTEDHLHLLLLLHNFPSINTPPPTKDWTNVNVHQPSYVGTVRTAVAQLEKTLSQEMKKLRDAELRDIQQYAVDVTLDPDTANPWLILSEDGKQVSERNVKKNLPDNTKRFSKHACVLGKESFSSKRFYYEVQVRGKTKWVLGVARESINRKEFLLRPDNGYWTIMVINGNEYVAVADPPVLLPVREELQKVGVFVDYEEGLVSFYDVETRVHLYSFTGCTFTEKLYPFLCPEPNDNGKNSAPLIISPVNHTD